MKKSLILLLFALLLSFSLLAKNDKPATLASNINGVEQIVMPSINNKEYRKTELNQRRSGRPNHFAKPIDVQITPKNSGTWESLSNGNMLWRLRILSPKAYSLNLGFTTYVMPASAKLFVYDLNQNTVVGPFTDKDNENHRELWTPIIKNEEIVIELEVSSADKDKVYLELTKVNHDYIGFLQSFASGSCNIDVACGAADGYPEVDEFRDIIKASGAYHYSGFSQCSGALINNTRNDCAPYFLTAQHCGVNANNQASFVVYWNYQNSTCRQPGSAESEQNGDGNFDQFNSGAAEVAEFEDSDFSLILLDDPLNAAHDLYMTGWNIEMELPQSAIGIHHPGVEEKRISFENDPLVWRLDGSGVNEEGDTTYIIVPDWDKGTTEGGSSGSPLFNADSELIGQLFGGLAACENDQYDYYGWIGHSWEGGGASTNRLKDWLDPDGTGMTQMQGRSCSYLLESDLLSVSYCKSLQDTAQFVLGVQGNFMETVTYEVINLPEGIEATFDQESVGITEQVVLTLSNLSQATASFAFEVKASEDGNFAEIKIDVEVFDGTPSPPQLQFPANQAEQVANEVTFIWTGERSSYSFEISKTASFDNPLFSIDQIPESNFMIDFLEENQQYYWRTKAYNPCGESDWSPTFTFMVGTERCVLYQVPNLPLIIPNDEISLVQDFEITYDVVISDLVITKVKGSHTWISDLVFSIANSEEEVLLMNTICFNEHDFDLGFEDEGLTEYPCPPIDGLRYQPVSPLRAFGGSSSQGAWEFRVDDVAFNDGGSVDFIELELCFYQQNNIVPTTQNYEVCQDDLLVIQAYANSEIQLVTDQNNESIPFTLTVDEDDPMLYNIEIETSSLEPGEQSLSLSDATGQGTSITIHIIPIPEGSTILLPMNGAIVPADIGIIEWQKDTTATLYNVTITNAATGAEFDNYSGNSTSFDLSLLEYNTDYNIEISYENACGTAVQNYSFMTGMPNNVNAEALDIIEIVPNPATNYTRIEWSQNLQDVKVKILDNQGKLVIEQGGADHRINLEGITPGIYFVKITKDDDVVVRKLLIN